MYLRSVLVTALAFVSLSAAAQDKIYKRNGSVIEAKVKEVGPRTISYQKANNPDGPEYVIERSEVNRITYQNGSEDYISARAPRGREASNVKYGNNIISAALLNISNTGIGFGLAYERMLDKEGHLSFYLPVNISPKGFTNNNDYSFDPLGVTQYSLNREQTIVQVMPGIKFYPTGSRGKAKYAIGAQLYYAKGQIEYSPDPWLYYPGPGGPWPLTTRRLDVETIGGMINNSVNISPNAHVYIGIDLGIGMTYSDKRADYFSPDRMVSNGTRGLIDFNFRLGYRF